ncbi:MAG: hypothetical protein GEV03_23610 [Streptosporangiales bacterium]|nr:hypothetical protein [Streptosporangiales bacterium]
MSAVETILAVAGVHLAAAVTPGPNVVLVIRTASAGSRRAAVLTAFGVVAAAAVMSATASIGLGLLLANARWVERGLALVCGAYLAYLGVQMWRHSRRPMGAAGRTIDGGCWAPFCRGLLTNLTNPKALVFYGSIFTAVLPGTATTALRIAAVVAVVISSSFWHLTLALAFSAGPLQRAYARAKTALDRTTGSLLILLGIRLVLAS